MLDTLKQIIQPLRSKVIAFDKRYSYAKYLVVVAIVAFSTFARGEYTLYRFYQIKSRQAVLDRELDRLVPKFQSDSLRLERIRTNPDAIEYLARERYYMKSPGEEIYILKSQDDTE